MQFIQAFRRFFSRLAVWRVERRVQRPAAVPLVVPPLTVHRDVSTHGVRVYSLCSTCGARLEASATLCEECARSRSRSAPPF